MASTVAEHLTAFFYLHVEKVRWKITGYYKKNGDLLFILGFKWNLQNVRAKIRKNSGRYNWRVTIRKSRNHCTLNSDMYRLKLSWVLFFGENFCDKILLNSNFFVHWCLSRLEKFSLRKCCLEAEGSKLRSNLGFSNEKYSGSRTECLTANI